MDSPPMRLMIDPDATPTHQYQYSYTGKMMSKPDWTEM